MMHTLMEINAGATTQQSPHVAAFLAKLWKLVDDSTTNDLIHWCKTGNSFIIRNQAKFARELLPLYYKHNNMASFVRQLNMYGFHKVVSVEQGGLKVDKDEMEFAHPFFLRGQESSLELIKRKIPAAKNDEESRICPDSLHKALMDVRHMKGRQENMDSKLLTMKRENEALWRELASLRQKHAKQTQIVSKLLQFLAGMMSSQTTPRFGTFKRRMPLMLDDIDGNKSRKLNPNNDDGQEVELTRPEINDVTEIFDTDSMEEEQEDHSDYLTGSSGSDGDSSHPHLNLPQSGSSPEVDPSALNPPLNKGQDGQKTKEMMKEIPKFSSTANNQSNQVSDNQQPTIYYLTRADGTIEPVQVVLSIPEMNIVQTSETDSTNSNSTTTTTTVSQPQTNTPAQAQTITTSTDIVPKMREGIVVRKDDLDLHLDDVQIGLDNLRDILKNDDYPMDHSTLFGVSWPGLSNSFDTTLQLFGESELGNLDLSKLQESMLSIPGEAAGTSNNSISENSGQELVSYNPSLFELTEDDSQFFDDSSNMFLDEELESMLTTEKSRLHQSISQASQPQTWQSSFEMALTNGGLTSTPMGSILSDATTPTTSFGTTPTTSLGTTPTTSLGTTPTTSLGTSTKTVVSNISGAGKRKRK